MGLEPKHSPRRPDGEKTSLAQEVKWNEGMNAYQQHLDELKLTQEDLKKKILDVGADFGHFAEIAKQKGYKDIYSIDIEHPADMYLLDTDVGLGAGKLIVADAFQLPFKDKTFDIAISFCAMPNIAGGENPVDYRNRVKKVCQEMLRVVKEGGEIRMARVVFRDDPTDKRERATQIKKALEWFNKSRHFEVVTDATGEINGHPSYLIRIKKLS